MNNNTNRINPLIVTNVLLALIAGCLMWNIVGPNVEPQAQAAQDAERLQTERQWMEEIYPDYPSNIKNPLIPHEFMKSADMFNNTDLVSENEFYTKANLLRDELRSEYLRVNQKPLWALYDFRSHLTLKILYRIEENIEKLAAGR